MQMLSSMSSRFGGKIGLAFDSTLSQAIESRIETRTALRYFTAVDVRTGGGGRVRTLPLAGGTTMAWPVMSIHGVSTCRQTDRNFAAPLTAFLIVHPAAVLHLHVRGEVAA